MLRRKVLRDIKAVDIPVADGGILPSVFNPGRIGIELLFKATHRADPLREIVEAIPDCHRTR